MADAANISLVDTPEQARPNQRPQHPLRPLPAMSANGAKARDITAEFTQAATGIVFWLLIEGNSLINSSLEDWPVDQGVLLYPF